MLIICIHILVNASVNLHPWVRDTMCIPGDSNRDIMDHTGIRTEIFSESDINGILPQLPLSIIAWCACITPPLSFPHIGIHIDWCIIQWERIYIQNILQLQILCSRMDIYCWYSMNDPNSTVVKYNHDLACFKGLCQRFLKTNPL